MIIVYFLKDWVIDLIKQYENPEQEPTFNILSIKNNENLINTFTDYSKITTLQKKNFEYLIMNYRDTKSENESIFKINDIMERTVKNIIEPRKIKTVLLLDLDETLGCFHIQYAVYSKFIINHKLHSELMNEYPVITKIVTDILLKNIIKKVLTPNIGKFLKNIEKLKKEKLINEVNIYSANSDNNNYPGYFDYLVKSIETICNVKGLIDNIETNVSDTNGKKNLIKYKKCKVIIIDDKPEVVKQTKNVLEITPFLIYLKPLYYFSKNLSNYDIPIDIYPIEVKMNIILSEFYNIIQQNYLYDIEIPNSIYGNTLYKNILKVMFKKLKNSLSMSSQSKNEFDSKLELKKLLNKLRKIFV
jgi:hypothetical protein